MDTFILVKIKMSNSDEDEQTIIDEDTCSESEITKFFKLPYNISSEEAISLQKSYILHLNNSRLDLSSSGTLHSIVNKTHINSISFKLQRFH